MMALPDTRVSKSGMAQFLRNWSLAATVFFVSFYPFLALYTPQPALLQRVPPAFASIYLRLSDIPLILTLAIHLVTEKRQFTSAPASLRIVTIPALLLALLALISMIWARIPMLALMAAIRLLAAAGLALIVGKSDRRWIVWPLVTSAVASAALGAAQYALRRSVGVPYLGEAQITAQTFGVPVVVADGIYHLRAIGFTTHPNILAPYATAAIILLIASALERHPASSGRQTLGIGVAVIGLALTYSRASWISLLIGLGVLIVGHFLQPDLRRRLPAMVHPLIVIALLAGMFEATQSRQIASRFGFGEGVTTSETDRGLLLQDALILWQQHPLTGIGAYNFAVEAERNFAITAEYSHDFLWQPVHNLLALTTTELGAAGGLIWLWVTLAPVTLAAIVWFRRGLDTFSFAWVAICGFLIWGGLLDHYVWSLPEGIGLMWISWASLLAAVARRRAGAPNEVERPRLAPADYAIAWKRPVIPSGLNIGRSLREMTRRPFPRNAWAAILVLLLAAFLGLHQLGTESLGDDELATWARIAQPSLAESILSGDIDSMWPAFHGSLYLFAKLAGYSEFALRFPSMLAGVISVAALYALGRSLYSRETGLIAVAFMAVSWLYVQYSQEARVYAFEIAFSILSTLAWLRMIRAVLGAGRARNSALAYFAAAGVMIYLHLSGLLILGMQAVTGLVICSRRRRGLSTLLQVYGGLALLSIPILLTIPAAMEDPFAWISSPGRLDQALISHLEYALNQNSSLVMVMIAVGVISLGAHYLGRARVSASDRKPLWFLPSTWLLAGWYLVPFLIFYLVSVTIRPVLEERYLLMAQPPVYLLMAHAIERFPAGRIVRRLGAAAIVGVLLYGLIFAIRYYSLLLKPDYRRIVPEIVSRSTAGQTWLVEGGWAAPFAFEYYGPGLLESHPQIILRVQSRLFDVTDDTQKFNPDFVWLIWRSPTQIGDEFLAAGSVDLLEQNDAGSNMILSLYRVRKP